MKVEETIIQELLASILNSRKYRGLGLNSATLKDVIHNEAPHCHSQKQLQKAVKRKLHNIIAPYLGNPDYTALAKELVSIKDPSLDSPQIHAFCLKALSEHASTAERVPTMTKFYTSLFGKTGYPETILDLACGLHPLAIPWMGLPASIYYYAYDIVQPRIDFINLFFSTIGLKPLAENRDILVNPPQIHADLCLLFKEAHRMEKRKPGCNRDFWASLNADCLAVSLPVQDLSGTHSLVKQHRQLVQKNLPDHCVVEELHIDDELVFLIKNQVKKNSMTKGNQHLLNSIQRFRDVLSEKEIQRLLDIQEKPLPIGIRLNPLKAKPEEAIQDLSTRYGWNAQPIPFCPTCWTITEAETSPGMTIEHRMGHYYIQEAASMVPVSLFEVNDESPLILDMAASPGGKTTHLIDRTKDRGFIIANDASKGRIAALRSVLSTWGGINLAVTNYPGEAFGSWYPETFDLVLLDAPCSMENLRPTPNRPLRQTTDDERLRLQERQIQLLTSGLQTLKIGGQLVYATCSLAPEEDEAVVSALLQAHPDAIHLRDVTKRFHFESQGLSGFQGQPFHPQLQHAVRLWPHKTGMSGFFCVVIKKTASIPVSKLDPPSRQFSKTNLELLDESIKTNVLEHLSMNYGFDLRDTLNSLSLQLYRRREQYILLPNQYIKHFVSLPYEFIGMALGRWIEDQFEPSHAFISRFGHLFTTGIIQIKDNEINQWIDGRDIRHPDTRLSAAGQFLLIKDQAGRNLGLGKLLPKRLRNMLPRSI